MFHLLMAMAGGADSLLVTGHSATPRLKVYEQSNGELIAQPTQPSLPAGTVNGLSIDSSGAFLAAAHNSGLGLYQVSDGNLNAMTTPVDAPSAARRVAFSEDADFLAVTETSSPFVRIFERSGTTFTKLANPGALPAGIGSGVAFSPNNTYLAVTHGGSPYLTIYKRSGSVFTKLPNPASLPDGDAIACCWSPDSVYLVVIVVNTDPHVVIYKRSSDTFTRLSVPTQPASATNHCAFSPNGNFLAVAMSSSPYVGIYARSGDTFTGLGSPASLPVGAGAWVGWSSDSNYLFIGHASSPFVTVYARSGSTFTKLPDLDEPPPSLVLAGALYPVGIPGI